MDRLISEKAVIDQLHQSINLLEAEDRIRELPSVDIPNKTGKWLGINKNIWCSNCAIGLSEYIKGEFTVDVEDLPPYCPNCGAKMGEPQESEDKK